MSISNIIKRRKEKRNASSGLDRIKKKSFVLLMLDNNNGRKKSI